MRAYPFLWFVLILTTAARAIAGEGADREMAESLHRMVKPLLEQEGAKDALPYLEKALAKDPTYYPAAVDAARVHARLGNAEEAAKLYRRAMEILEAVEKRTPEQEKLLHELQERMLEAKGAEGELRKAVLALSDEFREQATALAKAGKPYSALRWTKALLAFAPEDANGRTLRESLGRKAGRALERTVFPGVEWRDLLEGDDLSGWRIYTGAWELRGGTLRHKIWGDQRIFRKRPPLRDFALRANVRMNPHGSAYVLGRALPTGTFYAFGINLACHRNWRTGMVLKNNYRAEGFLCRDWKVVRRWRFDEADLGNLELLPEKWYRVEMQCRGALLRFLLNGRLLLEEEDETLREGLVGMQAHGGYEDTYTDIRNVYVRNLE